MARIPTSRFSFYLKITERFAPYLLSRLRILVNAFDIRDFLLLGGLGMLGYGLYGYDPRLALSVCGFLLMLLALAMRGKAKRAK